MENPQVEQGHIDIANEIAEQFAKLCLSSNEWRLLWVVLRKTWGWHKKEDRISLTQFEKATGMYRKSIVRSLSRLVSSRTLVVSSTPLGNVWSVNKRYSQWLVSPMTPAPRVVSSVSKVVSPTTHTKETITKETIHNINNTKKQTSKNSLVPLSNEELYELAGTLQVELNVVQQMQKEVMFMVRDGNKYKAKTIYNTVRKWIQMGIAKGQIQKWDEFYGFVFDSKSPEKYPEMYETYQRNLKTYGFI